MSNYPDDTGPNDPKAPWNEKEEALTDDELFDLFLEDCKHDEVCEYCGNKPNGWRGCCGEMHIVDAYSWEWEGWNADDTEEAQRVFKLWLAKRDKAEAKSKNKGDTK